MNDTLSSGMCVGDIQENLFSDLELTEKQFFILYMYSNGYSYRRISDMNNTSVDNIKYHLSAVADKLGCSSRGELRAIYLTRLLSFQIKLVNLTVQKSRSLN